MLQHGDLRCVIRESLRSDLRIRLNRACGLMSPAKQTNKSVLERGLAFVLPRSEMFLLGSTGNDGIHTGGGKSRYDQFKHGDRRKFVHRDVLYTRLPVPGANDVDCRGMFKHYANTTGALCQRHYRGLSPQGTYSLKAYSGDDVLRPGEEGF